MSRDCLQDLTLKKFMQISNRLNIGEGLVKAIHIFVEGCDDLTMEVGDHLFTTINESLDDIMENNNL